MHRMHPDVLYVTTVCVYVCGVCVRVRVHVWSLLDHASHAPQFTSLDVI